MANTRRGANEAISLTASNYIRGSIKFLFVAPGG